MTASRLGTLLTTRTRSGGSRSSACCFWVGLIAQARRPTGIGRFSTMNDRRPHRLSQICWPTEPLRRRPSVETWRSFVYDSPKRSTVSGSRTIRKMSAGLAEG